jgi:hypothetical protein
MALRTQIDDLILEYPPYEAWFIRAAFGSPPYTDASPPNPASREPLVLFLPVACLY